MKNKNLIITILIVVIIAAGSFFGGMQYQKMQRPSFGNFAGQRLGGQSGNGGGFARRFGGGNGGGGVAGSVLSISEDSMTVKLPDGSSKIVLISSSTSLNKAATASKSDLKTGMTVAVFGTTNSDGSITAQNIQLNPMMRAGAPKPTGAPQQ